ncbi:MAG: META domain-containing protein [Gammaproteobacteria bacterium]|nr:META domain-containing protein [Gammaproteobacteria bacterium]
MKMRIFRSTLLIIAVVFQGCNGSDHDTSQSLEDRVRLTVGQIDALEGIEWQLANMIVDNHEVTLLPESTVTFSYVGDGKVAGLASINRYFGNMLMNGDGEISWGEPGFGTTRMGGPPELMNQENEFLKSLRTIRRMYLANHTLTMESENKSVKLEFVKRR